MLSSVAGGATALVIGLILDMDLGYFVYCLWHFPDLPWYGILPPENSIQTTRIRFSRLIQKSLQAAKDRLFLRMLSGLMLTGIYVMLTIPIRVEYLVNPAYGLNFNNTMVLCITMVVPLVTDVSSTPVWGRAYDKFNLAYVRTFAGIFFLLGLFLSVQKSPLTLSCIRIHWNWCWWRYIGFLTLWVTRVAPKGRESSYMSLHLFFTGMRGLPALFWGIDLYEPGAQQSHGLPQ